MRECITTWNETDCVEHRRAYIKCLKEQLAAAQAKIKELQQLTEDTASETLAMDRRRREAEAHVKELVDEAQTSHDLENDRHEMFKKAIEGQYKERIAVLEAEVARMWAALEKAHLGLQAAWDRFVAQGQEGPALLAEANMKDAWATLSEAPPSEVKPGPGVQEVVKFYQQLAEPSEVEKAKEAVLEAAKHWRKDRRVEGYTTGRLIDTVDALERLQAAKAKP